MKWKKNGLLYAYKNESGEEAYTTAPFVSHLYEDVFRIYFSPRDIQNRSYPWFIDIDIFTGQVFNTATKPLIQPGSLGMFDDAGCILFQIIKQYNKQYLYYAGWSLALHVPFKCFIGVAISENDAHGFSKYSSAPILGANKFDAYLTGSPWVIIENNIWKMWYLTGIKWEENTEGSPKHYYTITYAESLNGIDWNPSGKICIPFKSDKEYAIARPVVIKKSGIYTMWYSYRATENCDTYQIGYAESADGIEWQRKDEEAGITTSETGWDCEMICYPFVFDHKGKTYMLYNGNGYGKTGIGLAELITLL